jgi:quercetin dioxygenase-like cupin family protein
MHAFSLADLITRHDRTGKLYLEFLRGPSLSMGLYRLPAGGIDPQQPHSEDEVYYVIRGVATVEVRGEQRPIATGDTIFVAAGDDHRFHSITEDLDLLVFFAPPEYALASPHHET